MSLARSLPFVLLLLFPARAMSAQAPADSSAVAPRIDRLPVLDDDGNVIDEHLILARMRKPSGQIMRPALGALAGLLLFAVMNQPQNNADCSIYEPCTPREKWRMNAAPLFGVAVGLMVGIATPDGSINRSQAVEILRAERRAEKQARTP